MYKRVSLLRTYETFIQIQCFLSYYEFQYLDRVYIFIKDVYKHESQKYKEGGVNSVHFSQQPNK